MVKNKIVCLLFALLSFLTIKAKGVLVEAESFDNKGGWVVDQQFMDHMGSPYLLAHGLGNPVLNASTSVSFSKKGVYKVYVRTYNWTSPWTEEKGPGSFRIAVDDKFLPAVLGNTGNKWEWQYAGEIKIKENNVLVSLHDLTGFDGRVDAIYFDREGNQPPSEPDDLCLFRKEMLDIKTIKPEKFDLVVVGGGIAGICSAVSAGRLGLKVALVNNRPVWGGNNSSEVRVHLGGAINIGKYPNLGNLVREFGPSKGGNARPAANYEDDKKQKFLDREKNVVQFANYHVYKVDMDRDGKIASVTARHIENGDELVLESSLFVDCTGDGNLGYLAGADYVQGTESFDTYNEPSAPEDYKERVMGASVQWYSCENSADTLFPDFQYGIKFDEASAQKVLMGEWTWETGMSYDQVEDAERIRDYGLAVIYSNWSFLKNKSSVSESYAKRYLNWVAFIAGKRESRRLLGDIVLTENDIIQKKKYPDATAATTWSIDLHYPDPENSKYFPGEEFKSVCKQNKIEPYDVPYRCLYSRNVSNLFMAGRNISVSHVALGTVRVMRTLGMFGEVVGMASYLCHKYGVMPRDIYPEYFNEMTALMEKGIGKTDAPDNQNYNVVY